MAKSRSSRKVRKSRTKCYGWKRQKAEAAVKCAKAGQNVTAANNSDFWLVEWYY